MTPSVQAPVKLYRMSLPNGECPWGRRAVDLLNEQNIAFEDHLLRSREDAEAFKAKHEVSTTPQVFWGEERIGGYTELADHLGFADPEAGDEKSYAPVVALFSTAALVSLAASLGVSGFMGVALSMLASLKLMDLDAFARSFENYDLITQRVKPYGKLYPFAELAIGLGFLSGAAPLLTGAASLAIGLSGSLSVFKAVYLDKKDLNCACIGGNSKTPLGVVSFAENAIMAVMGAILLLSAVGGVEVSGRAIEATPGVAIAGEYSP